MWKITATAGSQAGWMRIGDPIRTGIGAIRTPVGRGFLMRTSGRLRITTDAGFAWKIPAGYGSPAMNGDRRGSPGVRAMITSAGHRFPRRPLSIRNPVSAFGWIGITTSVLPPTVSANIAILVRRSSAITFFRGGETRRSSIRPSISPISRCSATTAARGLFSTAGWITCRFRGDPSSPSNGSILCAKGTATGRVSTARRFPTRSAISFSSMRRKSKRRRSGSLRPRLRLSARSMRPK